jgi:hypothetical protein
MKPAHSLLSLALLATASLPAQLAPASPELRVVLTPAMVNMTIASEEASYVGVFLLSPNPTLAHFLVGLPPLLDQAFVLHWGLSEAPRFGLSLPEITFPPGIFLYVQGVTISDVGILATEVDSFVLDGSGKSEGEPVAR